MKKSRLWFALVLGLTPMLAQAQAPAPSAPDETELLIDLLDLMNTPVVGASKREQKLIDTPQAIEVLSGEEIRAMGIYKLSDALKHMTSVDVLELDNVVTNVTIRGAMQQGQPRTVQILIDSVPLYNAEMGAVDIDNLPVAVDQIEKVEVVRGPSSSLYGANAVAGVIAITTKKSGEGLKGGLRASQLSHQTFRYGMDVQAGNKGMGVTAGYYGASLNETNDQIRYNFSNGPLTMLDNNRGHQNSAFARGELKYDQGMVWAGLARATKWADIHNYPNVYPLQSFLSQTLNAGWSHGWAEQFRTELRFSRLENQYDIQVDPKTAAGFGLLSMFDPSMAAPSQILQASVNQMYSWIDFTSDLVELQINWDPSKSFHVVAGADHRRYASERSALVTLPDKEEHTSTGGFLNLDWNPMENLTLSAGARVENESLGGSRVSPRAAITWSPVNGSSLRAGYYSSTRSPQIQEAKMNFAIPLRDSQAAAAIMGALQQGVPIPMGNLQTTVPIYKILPNSALDPEEISSMELGWRQIIGSVNLDLTLFRMQFSDLIAQLPTPSNAYAYTAFPQPIPLPTVPPSQISGLLFLNNQYKNAGDATNTGAELSLTWKINTYVSAGMNATTMKYQMDDTNEDFTYAPKFKGNAWMRLRAGKAGAYLAFQHIDAVDIDFLPITTATARTERKAINQLQAHFTYEIAKGLQVNLFGRNLLKSYTDYGAGGPTRTELLLGARREFGGGLSYRF